MSIVPKAASWRQITTDNNLIMNRLSIVQTQSPSRISVNNGQKTSPQALRARARGNWRSNPRRRFKRVSCSDVARGVAPIRNWVVIPPPLVGLADVGLSAVSCRSTQRLFCREWVPGRSAALGYEVPNGDENARFVLVNQSIAADKKSLWEH